MARPRVFVSSTYYDLKHVRASLEVFIEGLGFEPILAEYGSIPYDPSQPLDESCYREAESCDILVLIIGGRYGTIASSRDKENGDLEKQVESITRKEFTKAHNADIPVFVLIESGVFSEYETYLRNKANENISYAHVDSVEVFKFIEFVYDKQMNNPIQSFEKGIDIENWLRDQWAGIFQDLLKQRKDNRRLSDLASQIRQLEAVNSTLKSYMESMLETVSPEKSSALIERENRSLSDAQLLEKADDNRWLKWMRSRGKFTEREVLRHSREISSVGDIIPVYGKYVQDREFLRQICRVLFTHEKARKDFNDLRDIFALKKVRFTQKALKELKEKLDELGEELGIKSD